MPDQTLDTLLEQLARRSGCTYQSDLTQSIYKERVYWAVEQIDASAYPAEVWCQALSYITGQALCAAQNEAARALLLKHLSSTRRAGGK